MGNGILFMSSQYEKYALCVVTASKNIKYNFPLYILKKRKYLFLHDIVFWYIKYILWAIFNLLLQTMKAEFYGKAKNAAQKLNEGSENKSLHENRLASLEQIKIM